MTDYKQDYNNGKIHGWNGGDCPLHPETEVRYWKCSGSTGIRKAENTFWGHNNCISDIIAFQVVKAYAEPKVIWVNEYADGTCWAGCDEETAKMCAAKDATRIAVKYVEVVDDKEVK